MKTNTVLLILICILIQISLFAQNATKREANYHFKQANYEVALEMYEKLWKNDTTDAEINFNLGICYLNCNNNPSRALHFLLNVEQANTDNPEYLLNLGKAFLYNYDYNNAQSYLLRSKNGYSKKTDKQEECDLWLSYLQSAKKLTRSPLDVSFVNMGKYINSKMDELTPYTTADNEILLYTTNRKYDRTFYIYTFDVYQAYQSNGIFKKGKPVSRVNSVDDEFMAGTSLSNERIFVQLQGYEGFQDIIYSERKGKGFQNKFGLNKTVNSRFAEFAATETENSDTLFFSSDRDDGFGGMDLYFCLKLPTGEWSEARNCGDKINSAYDEDFPVLANNGSKLYFTSNRPESMGGFDIFECSINQAKEFSKPRNIGYPLNDVYDNKTIAFSDNNRYAYVSAIKPDGFGYTDIYRVIFNQKDPAVKIYIMKFFTQQAETKLPFAELDTTLNIKVFHQKGKVVFGEYKYISKASQATIALPPDAYTVNITGTKTEENNFKLVVPDEPSGSKIEHQDVILKLK